MQHGAHTNSVAGDVLHCVRSAASDWFLLSARTLTFFWSMSFCMRQLIADVELGSLCSILQCSHFDIIHGAPQLSVYSTVQDLCSQQVDVALYHQLRLVPVPVTTLLPCIVSGMTDAIGDRTVATSPLLIAVVLSSSFASGGHANHC